MSLRISVVVFALGAVLTAPACSSSPKPKCNSATKCTEASLPDASSDSGGSCPAVEPVDGVACTSPGVSCAGYGALSCPETASCDSTSHWRITCPKLAFGSDATTCGCAHPGG